MGSWKKNKERFFNESTCTKGKRVTRAFIEEAMVNYLKKGGIISKMKEGVAQEPLLWDINNEEILERKDF